MTEIVKVQRPSTTNDPAAPWLIYDKAERHIESRPGNLVRQAIKDAMGDDYKAYFVGAWSSVVGWGLSKRVKNQNW